MFALRFEIQPQNDTRYVALVYPETLWKERERSNKSFAQSAFQRLTKDKSLSLQISEKLKHMAIHVFTQTVPFMGLFYSRWDGNRLYMFISALLHRLKLY